MQNALLNKDYVETKEEVHIVHCIYIRIANVNVNTDNLFYKCFDFKTKMLSHFLFVDFGLNKPFLNISEDESNFNKMKKKCTLNKQTKFYKIHQKISRLKRRMGL